jgi:capsid protein
MLMIKEARNAATNWLTRFGRYIAAEPNQQRRDPGTRIQSSDALLDSQKRRRVIEGARELNRNFSVAAWAIRKHLDYVSTFTFQANTDDPVFNERLEALMNWYNRPINCDIAGRHSLRRMVRLAEMRRVLDGDVFLVKLRDGRLQAIEGDRVRSPDNRVDPMYNWVHGIKVGAGGSMNRVAVWSRSLDGQYTFERDISAGNVIQLAYFDSFDQVRGVSPLTSAIASFQDSLEVTDYARAKAKITQLFALAITREMADDDAELYGDEYKVDLGRGPVKLELDPGDKAEFLESRHPSTEFQAFLTLSLQAALKSLDIPWSFYDEAYTNFFGSRAALIQYQQACKSKREDLKEMLDRITVWKIQQWMAAGILSMPAGVQQIDQIYWDWIPAGVPYWNPEQEITGDLMAVEGKLRTRSEIRREKYGDDWRDVVRKLAEERDYLTQYGFDESTEGLVSVPVMAEPDVPEETTETEGEDNGNESPDDVS